MASRMYCAIAVLLLTDVYSALGGSCPDLCVCKPTDRWWNNQQADCSNRSLTELPRGFPSEVVVLKAPFNTFPELSAAFFGDTPSPFISVFLNNNSIASVDPNAFKQLEHLWHLDLSGNKLQAIHKDTFQFNKKLSSLLLAGNTIQIPSETALFEIPWLEKLDLSYNNIDSLGIASFTHLNRLKHLRLHNNRIQKLDQNSFRNLEHLIHLFLEHNDLLSVDTDTFLHNKKLVALNLSKNRVMVPTHGPFLRIPSLERLYLNGCNLTYLPGEMFEMTTRVRYLFLDNNHLRELDLAALTYLSDLVHLHAWNNPLACSCALKDLWQWCVYRRVRSEISCLTEPERSHEEGGSWDVVAELACAASTEPPPAPPAGRVRDQSRGPSAGHVAGYVILALVLACVAVAVAVFVWRRSTRRDPRSSSAGSLSSASYADILPLHDDA